MSRERQVRVLSNEQAPQKANLNVEQRSLEVGKGGGGSRRVGGWTTATATWLDGRSIL